MPHTYTHTHTHTHTQMDTGVYLYKHAYSLHMDEHYANTMNSGGRLIHTVLYMYSTLPYRDTWFPSRRHNPEFLVISIFTLE